MDSIQLVDVGVEYPVNEADAGALVWILVWQLDVDLPESAFEWRCNGQYGIGTASDTAGCLLSDGPLNLT